MNSGRYFMPNMRMGFNPMMRAPMMGSVPTSFAKGSSILGNNVVNPRGIGLFGRIARGIRSFNWSGLLTNANKTINVVNQTIPLVRQAGPMFNNMRSMFKIAKAFGNETTSGRGRRNNNQNINNYSKNRSRMNEVLEQKKEAQNDNLPSFFV